MAATGTRESPHILGLTGPIACGKTTVGNMLLELGARERIDADRVVHELMRPGTATTAAIIAAFGDGVRGTDGGINRQALGAIVFRDREALGRLESITHPAVRTQIRRQIESYEAGDVVIVDAIKLLQSELLPLVAAVWVVCCREETQLTRLTAIRGLAESDARARLTAMPRFEHEKVTEVIENGGSLEHLRDDVAAAWGRFLKRR